ncbi:hypothetical protein ACMFMG_000640 [Clarireedia jacksonii]
MAISTLLIIKPRVCGEISHVRTYPSLQYFGPLMTVASCYGVAPTRWWTDASITTMVLLDLNLSASSISSVCRRSPHMKKPSSQSPDLRNKTSDNTGMAYLSKDALSLH